MAHDLQQNAEKQPELYLQFTIYLISKCEVLDELINPNE